MQYRFRLFRAGQGREQRGNLLLLVPGADQRGELGEEIRVLDAIEQADELPRRAGDRGEDRNAEPAVISMRYG